MNRIYKKLRSKLQIRAHFDYYRYRFRKRAILSNISRKTEPIKVVFFVISIAMWKLDELFEKLRADKCFSPCIISFFVPSDNEDYSQRNQKEIQEYFERKGFLYYNLYDFEKNKWFDIESLSPDIVFYTQPYGVGLRRYNIKALWKSSLFFYIPYCLVSEYYDKGLNTLLQNISLRVFAPTSFDKDYWSRVMINHGKNIAVTGYPSFDYLIDKKECECEKWKNTNKSLKRIIWAPHHSILESDSLSYSNFLRMANEMQIMAKELRNNFQFAFKPHPRLRPKLENHPDWGYEKTNDYYNWWREQDNTSFVDGDYFDLFLSSDAMIHDSSTFMGEYLCTEKPVMFIKNKYGKMELNDFGKMCLNNHYIGYSIQDIMSFLIDVVYNENDPMKPDRKATVELYFKKCSDSSVADRIYKEIKQCLRLN